MKAVEQGEPFTLFHGHTMRVVPVGPCTFRIRLKRAGGAFAEPPLLRYGILREPENRCPYEQVEDDEAITIATTQAELRIDRRDGQWSLCDGQRGELLRTAAAPSVGRSGGFELCCTLDEGETVYGLGNAAEERMQLRGSKVEIRLDPKVSSAPIPYVMSSRGWAILMNTTWAHTFDIGSAIHDVMTVAGEHGELDFYLFCGSGYGELLDRYTEIAGKPRLLPIWAYGLTYIRDILTNDREVLDDVLKFRQEDIPCDMVGLGRGWTETDQDGSTHKKWHPGRFSIPSGHIDNSYTFTDTLRRNGFKLCLLMHCFGYDLTEYEERKMKPAEEAGDAAGEHPERWYDHFRTFAAEGVAAFRFTSFSRIEPTPGRSWANGMNDDELANLYPVLLGKQVHEGYAEQTGKRPFIHTVAGYTGNQQFTAMESGKYNSRGGAVLRALNLGVSGHAHVASHINIDIREGIHCGFLQPWAFINSGSHFRNPCVIEKPLREMFRKYARLRYRLIPYLYATAHSAARTGMPIARAMPLLFPEDPQCADLQRQYMLGDYLLVGAYINSVYLPEGRWIDFWTGATCEGGQTITCAVPDDAGGPLFIREGAILPMWPEMDYIEKSSVERMELHVYPGQADSQFTLYEDDGETFGYLHGRLAVTVVRCEAGASHITIR
ncbi:MAG: xylS, partial [Paenibacillus sp.]|nr:xylS [Paenibacillus sp.]